MTKNKESGMRDLSSPDCITRLEVCNEEKGKLKARLSINKADTWAGFASSAIFGGIWLILGILAIYKIPPALFSIISVLAGKKTIASFSLAVNVSMVLSWTLTAATSGWAIMERRHKKSEIKRLTRELDEVKKKFDPDKMSSMLTPCGDTNTEDLP